jgi:hypothetical protein
MEVVAQTARTDLVFKPYHCFIFHYDGQLLSLSYFGENECVTFPSGTASQTRVTQVETCVPVKLILKASLFLRNGATFDR